MDCCSSWRQCRRARRKQKIWQSSLGWWHGVTDPPEWKWAAASDLWSTIPFLALGVSGWITCVHAFFIYVFIIVIYVVFGYFVFLSPLFYGMCWIMNAPVRASCERLSSEDFQTYIINSQIYCLFLLLLSFHAMCRRTQLTEETILYHKISFSFVLPFCVLKLWCSLQLLLLFCFPCDIVHFLFDKPFFFFLATK